jgi:predicted AAA+ superfamily ATPase
MNFERSIDRVSATQILDHSMPFIQVLLGPRQVGKSTFVNEIVKRWDGYKIVETADRLVTPTTEWIDFLWQRAREQKGPVLLAIDEIQKNRGWADAIKPLFEKDRNNPNLRVLVTGSASLGIQTGLNDSLAGCYELVKYPHWGLSIKTN